jgi:flagellar assembly protein FliH
VGRVVKGASQRADRYTLTVPLSSGAEFATPVLTDDFVFSSATPAPVPAAAAPAEPAVDIAAVRAQAEAIVAGAEASAEALLADAHERARSMIDAAAASADAIAESARAGAHAEGYAAGTRAAEAEMSEMLATMQRLVESARLERHTLIESAEPELVRMAMGIAERVLHQQIALDPNVVVEMAKVAISRLVDRETVTVRVNPADLERMKGHRDDVLALGDVNTMRIIEDQRVDRGGVVVETDGGSIDARIATQLAEARKVLHIEDDVIVQPPAPTVELRAVNAG